MAREREYRGDVYSRGLPEDHEKGLMVGGFYIGGVRGGWGGGVAMLMRHHVGGFGGLEQPWCCKMDPLTGL